jgi:hypothetical protein
VAVNGEVGETFVGAVEDSIPNELGSQHSVTPVTGKVVSAVLR